MADPASRYCIAVRECKRTLIIAALWDHRGNRTRAAHALGLQRTYLCRLIRELGISGVDVELARPRGVAR